MVWWTTFVAESEVGHWAVIWDVGNICYHFCLVHPALNPPCHWVVKVVMGITSMWHRHCRQMITRWSTSAKWVILSTWLLSANSVVDIVWWALTQISAWFVPKSIRVRVKSEWFVNFIPSKGIGRRLHGGSDT